MHEHFIIISSVFNTFFICDLNGSVLSRTSKYFELFIDTLIDYSCLIYNTPVPGDYLLVLNNCMLPCNILQTASFDQILKISNSAKLNDYLL